MANIPDPIPNITPYQKALNAYNPSAYPAHKKITAEEWNALMMSLFAQGNRQEYYLDQLLNVKGHLPDIIEVINAILETLPIMEDETIEAINLAINAHNTQDPDPHKAVLEPIRNGLSLKQDQTDPALTTEDKTVAGAINELKVGLDGKLDEIPFASPLVAGIVKVGENLSVTIDGTLNAESGYHGTEYELEVRI